MGIIIGQGLGMLAIGLNISATLLSYRRNRNCWLLWAIGCVLMLVKGVAAGDLSGSLLWAVNLGLNVVGYRSWRHPQPEADQGKPDSIAARPGNRHAGGALGQPPATTARRPVIERPNGGPTGSKRLDGEPAADSRYPDREPLAGGGTPQEPAVGSSCPVADLPGRTAVGRGAMSGATNIGFAHRRQRVLGA